MSTDAELAKAVFFRQILQPSEEPSSLLNLYSQMKEVYPSLSRRDFADGLLRAYPEIGIEFRRPATVRMLYLKFIPTSVAN